MKKNKRRSVESLKAGYGRKFVLMWEIGFVLFFLIPLFKSLWFAFSNTSPIDRNLNIFRNFSDYFAGTTHFKYLFFENSDFVDKITDSLGTFLYSVPLVIVISFIIALFLNDKFKGRLFFRAVYFLPVIIASGAVMTIISKDLVATSMLSSSNGSSGVVEYKSVEFVEMLNGMGFSEKITAAMETAISAIFNLIWSSGVQIILFLAGLQSIPYSLVEVSKIEGATSWERLWYITIPMMSDIISLNLIYTSIAVLTSASNPFMQLMFDFNNQARYNESSAMVWVYCPFVLVIVLLMLIIVRRASKTGGRG